MIRITKITDAITLISIFLFLQYVFWFQYAVGEISWFLTVIGIVMILCVFLHKKLNVTSIKHGLFVVAFIVSTLLSCLLFPLNRSISMTYFSRILRYLVPFFAICLYVENSYKRLKLLLLSFSISGVLLSSSLYLSGEFNMVFGGFTIGDLNPNVFSSYALAGLLGSVSLLNCIKNKALRVLLLLSIVIGFIAQVQAGSRRGILVYMLVLFMYFFAVTTIKYKKNRLAKLLMFFAGIVVVLIIVFDFSIIVPGYTNLSQLLFKRTSGDLNRSIYQKVASKLFLKQPIIGNGLGSVGQVAGMYSHSLYYETLASNGVIGLLIIIVPLLNIIKNSFRTFKEPQLSTEHKMQSAALVIAIASVLITGIAVAFIYDAIFYIMLSLIVSFRATTANNNLGENETGLQ